MNSFLKKYFKGDQGIWGIYMLLCVVSIIVMYSASSFFVYQNDTLHWQPIMEHIFYLALGGVFAWLLHFCLRLMVDVCAGDWGKDKWRAKMGTYIGDFSTF